MKLNGTRTWPTSGSEREALVAELLRVGAAHRLTVNAVGHQNGYPPRDERARAR